jgi:hypothetical protein
MGRDPIMVSTPVPPFPTGILVRPQQLATSDTCFQDGISTGEDAGAPEALPIALCERSLAAMARDKWDRAQAHASAARAALWRARSEDSFATPLVCAVQARTALHREIPRRHVSSLSVLSGCGRR